MADPTVSREVFQKAFGTIHAGRTMSATIYLDKLEQRVILVFFMMYWWNVQDDPISLDPALLWQQ